MSIVVRTLSEQVFEIVREQIIDGKLSADAPIRQDALASDLGVSKIPLREALARLEQEGLLISQANRGYFVQPMSVAQVEEIYALRGSIEPSAASFASRVASEAQRAQAKRALQDLENSMSRNAKDIGVRNRDFHTSLVRPGGKLLTTQLVERLAILAERYVIAHLTPAGRDMRAHAEHRQLLDAWLKRDKRLVEKLLKLHIRSTLNDLRAEFAAGVK